MVIAADAQVFVVCCGIAQGTPGPVTVACVLALAACFGSVHAAAPETGGIHPLDWSSRFVSLIELYGLSAVSRFRNAPAVPNARRAGSRWAFHKCPSMKIMCGQISSVTDTFWAPAAVANRVASSTERFSGTDLDQQGWETSKVSVQHRKAGILSIQTSRDISIGQLAQIAPVNDWIHILFGIKGRARHR